MKYLNFQLLLGIFAFSLITCQLELIEKNSKKEEGRVVATAAVVGQLATLVVKGLFSLFKSATSDPEHQATTFMFERQVVLKAPPAVNGIFTVTLIDVATHTSVNAQDTTVEGALSKASQAFMSKLVQNKILSIHDLCHVGHTFAHPDQELCPGVTLHACDLVVGPTVDPECVDSVGESYCKAHKDHCTHPLFKTMMIEHCFKTCQNCYLPEKDPCVP
ncbi:hypothetical protein SNEBB_008135 [Seison nebaliae]|nr:hypothetical protein SNEBB_008135 [Seison nebaliae]